MVAALHRSLLKGRWRVKNPSASNLSCFSHSLADEQETGKNVSPSAAAPCLLPCCAPALRPRALPVPGCTGCGRALEAVLPTEFGFFFPNMSPFFPLLAPAGCWREAEKLGCSLHTHTHVHTLRWPFLMGCWCCPGWGEPRGNRGPPAPQLHPGRLSRARRLHPTTATSWGSRSWRTGGWRLAAGRWSHMPSSRTR